MIMYPEMNPIAIQLGPLAIHWYGLMYLFAFASAYGLLLLQMRRGFYFFTSEEVSDLIFYGALGAILGGRLGYMLFYQFDELLHSPWTLFMIWKGGMSFHGGLLGVMASVAFFSYKKHHAFFDVTDFIAPVVPVGLAFGRIGNFINGELWGRVTEVPWGMIFPNAGDLPRHPSQLYEFFLEGIVLFCILWLFSKKKRPRGAISGLFLLGYGCFRFTIEFFREPDIQKGFIALNWMTEGQLLSLPMILVGIGLLIWAYRGKRKAICNNI